MSIDHLDDTGVRALQQWLDVNLPYNDSEFHKVELRDSLSNAFPLFITFYGITALLGVVLNACVLCDVTCRPRCPLIVLLLQLVAYDLFKLLLVVPLTLFNMMTKHWLMGKALCYLLPLLQALPNHASMLTYVMMAVDRYRTVVYPLKPALPTGVLMIGVWGLAFCAVLPFAGHIKYVDIGRLLGPEFYGVGVCFNSFEPYVQQYLRAIFVLTYCLPLLVIASLFIRTSAELCQNVASHNFDESVSKMCVRYAAECTGRDIRIQRLLALMVVLYALCWLPINILNIVTHFVYETNDNTHHFDISYMCLTLVGYLSTCVNPMLALVLARVLRGSGEQEHSIFTLTNISHIRQNCSSMETWSISRQSVATA